MNRYNYVTSVMSALTIALAGAQNLQAESDDTHAVPEGIRTKEQARPIPGRATNPTNSSITSDETDAQKLKGALHEDISYWGRAFYFPLFGIGGGESRR